MKLFTEWRARRALDRKAVRYLRTLQEEPAETDVRWLASQGTGGDADHARWELRYARQALGLVAAQRDALDDHTGSAVARAVEALLESDPRVDPAKRHVAERQFNTRLRTYREILAQRDPREATGARLGRALLGFAGQVGREEQVARAGEVLAGYLHDANEALRREFGTAMLPETVQPSVHYRSRG